MRWVGVVVLAVLVIVPLAGAQEPEGPDASPAVVFEDAAIEAPIDPEGGPGAVELPVAIGCDAAETAETTTVASVEPVEVPSGVRAQIRPSVMSWTAEAGDCPAPDGQPFQGNVTALVGVDLTVPAFQEQTVPLALTVDKVPPEPASSENRTYGPYHANVTATPAYGDRYSVTVEERTREARPGDQVVFPVTVANEGNDATRFELATADVPDTVEASVDPATLTVPVDGEKAAELTVQARDPATIGDAVARLALEVNGASETRPSATVSPTTTTVKVVFRVQQGSGTDVPAPGGAAALAALAAAGLALAAPGLRARR